MIARPDTHWALEKKRVRSVITLTKKKAHKNGSPWMLPLLMLIGAIVLAIPTHALSNTAPLEQSEGYQLEPSWWEGLISREGRTFYPLILVIEEVYPDHSFIGHMKWNPNRKDIVAIEGSAEGNHLTFIDTVMLAGWPGNVTGIKRDVIITGNRMTGTNTNMNGVVTLTAERRPFDEQLMPEYSAKAMKADLQRWKTEMEMCRQAKLARQREACWQSLALQTHVHVFCNEVSDKGGCQEKVLSQQGNQQSLSVAASLAQVIKSLDPESKLLLKDAEAPGNKANDQSLGRRIAEAQRKIRTATPEERVRLQREIESFHQELMKLIPSDLPEFYLSNLEAAMPQHELECAAGNGKSCYEPGKTQANIFDIPDAKKTLAQGCDKGTWQGCLWLSALEIRSGDPEKARALYKTACETLPNGDINHCGDLDDLLRSLPPNTNVTQALFPTKYKAKFTKLEEFLQSSNLAMRTFGEGLTFFLAVDRRGDTLRAYEYFKRAASQGLNIARALREVGIALRGPTLASPVLQASGPDEMLILLKASLAFQEACRLGDRRSCLHDQPIKMDRD